MGIEEFGVLRRHEMENRKMRFKSQLEKDPASEASVSEQIAEYAVTMATSGPQEMDMGAPKRMLEKAEKIIDMLISSADFKGASSGAKAVAKQKIDRMFGGGPQEI